MVDGRADFAGGSVDEAKAHVAARVFDTVKIARDVSVRSQQHHAAGVREVIVLGVIAIAEVGCFGERVDGLAGTGEVVPARRSFRTPEMRHSGGLLGGSLGRTVAG